MDIVNAISKARFGTAMPQRIQLHKGDGGSGLFVQLTAEGSEDAAIPDKAGSEAAAISFGTLKLAQALGDGQALADSGRKVICFHLGMDAAADIRLLAGQEIR